MRRTTAGVVMILNTFLGEWSRMAVRTLSRLAD
jgi:hypothetical protein